MNLRIISSINIRYLFLYTRTPMRRGELVFSPMVDLLVWGNLTVYLHVEGGGNMDDKIKLLIGGVILWDVLFRAQQGVAVSFLEDVWTRNLLNVFVAPVRNVEYVLATYCVGLMRIAVTVGLMILVAFTIYDYDIFGKLGWSLVPFVVNLLLFGWSLGMISTALILRWGQAAESLAWAVPFFIQPFVGAFYSIESIKPTWMQYFSYALPPTHVFEGMRDVIKTQAFSPTHFYWASGLNVIFMALSAWIFASTLAAVRRKGLLTKFATQ
jgi:ABC-2 type transport system permease protein